MIAQRTIILVAGASGSGKSRLARLAGCPLLKLDDFYHDADHPGLSRTFGIVDWDDVGSWDLAGAVDAMERLMHAGRADVPTYDIALSRRVGRDEVTFGDHPVLIAEGIFAPDVLAPARAAGLHIVPLWLDRPRTATAIRRLSRDIRQKRKPVPILIRRGFALWRAEPRLRRRALQLGFEPVTLPAALTRIDALRGGAP